MVWKWGMYLLSMMLFAVIVLILSFPFQIHFGKQWEFVGWGKIWDWLWWFPFLFICIILADIFFYLWFKYVNIRGSQHISCKIKKIESLQSDILAFLAAYFVPLVSFSISKTNHQIVLIILFVVIGLLYVNGDLYYQNPTLALIGFKTYKVHCDMGENSELKEKCVLSLSSLQEDDRISYICLSENVWFAIKKNK